MIYNKCAKLFVYFFFLVITERRIYQTITAAKPAIPKKISRGMQTSKKMKLTLLSFQDRFLNFNENIGISETKRYENIATRAKRYKALKLSEIKKECAPTTKDPQKRAFAGTGSPINELVCRSSTLNLANLNAEKTEIAKAR